MRLDSGTKRAGAHELGHRVVAPAVAPGPHQVLGVDHADHVVDPLAHRRHTAQAVEDHDLHHVVDPEVGRAR